MKSPFSLSIILLTCILLGSARVDAQSPGDENRGSQIVWDDANAIFRFSWWSPDGRTDFLQHSEDLTTWLYLPIIEPGDDSAKEWGFQSDGDRFFLRVRSAESPTGDPYSADFDSDWLGSWWEITHGYDPLVADAPGADPDGDGLGAINASLLSPSTSSPASSYTGAACGLRVWTPLE